MCGPAAGGLSAPLLPSSFHHVATSAEFVQRPFGRQCRTRLNIGTMRVAGQRFPRSGTALSNVAFGFLRNCCRTPSRLCSIVRKRSGATASSVVGVRLMAQIRSDVEGLPLPRETFSLSGDPSAGHSDHPERSRGRPASSQSGVGGSEAALLGSRVPRPALHSSPRRATIAVRPVTGPPTTLGAPASAPGEEEPEQTQDLSQQTNTKEGVMPASPADHLSARSTCRSRRTARMI